MPIPPRWVEDLLAGSSARHIEPEGDVEIRTAGPLAHARTRIRNAVRLRALALRTQVTAACLALIHALKNLDRYPVRFWNFVPRIGETMSTDLDRYMVFNAGRYDAYTEFYGHPSVASGNCRFIGTASAVGITGADLWMHCLAIDRPGVPIENPRQMSAWHYSDRYGPLPPCFSRATIVPICGHLRLLIGGTASVVGEDSQHLGKLDAQLEETLLNMEVLVRTASGDADCHAPLQRLIDVRVYVTEATHAEPVKRILAMRCPQLRALDFVVAQLCRRDLLVEIEGVAEL